MVRRPALALCLVVLLVACAVQSQSLSDAPTTPSPTAQATADSTFEGPDVSVTPAVSATPTTAQPLSPDSIAEVVTSDLVMRSLPGVTDESIILDRVLQPGDRLFVMDGPVAATGYDWYQVQLLGDRVADEAGWVAAMGRDGEAWITSTMIECPDPALADVFELDAFHRLELLSCLGDRQIQVTVQAMGICSGYIEGPPNFVFEPTWLGMGSTCGWGREGYFLFGMQPFLEPAVGSGFPPGAQRLDWYQLTGQFDHPEAKNCVLRELSGGDPDMPPMPDMTPEQVVLLCRSHFAVALAERVSGP